MRFGFFRFLVCFSVSVSSLAVAQHGHGDGNPAPASGGDFSTVLNPTEEQKVPKGVIIVKGAWSGSSDKVTPLPEDGSVANSVYTNPYFGIIYPLPQNWNEKHKGPPPSDSGLISLALITPTEAYKGPNRGSISITAQDMFFTPLPANNALELIDYKKDNLPDIYKMELPPSETKIGGRPFRFFAYWSPVAELHWYVFATEIRCHTVEIVVTSRDTKLLESLVLGMNKMTLPAEAGPTLGTGGGDFPVCVKDYARDENIVNRVNPVLTERRFNAIPVRIIIDKQGKVKHIHFLSAFSEQQSVIAEALKQWKFRPYLQDGKAAEVETGIMFGRSSAPLPKGGSRSSTD